MSRTTTPLFGTIRTDLNFWPSYVDIFAIVLMVLILRSFLQTFIGAEYLELATLRQAQKQLEQALRDEFRAEVEAGFISFDRSPNLLQIRFSEKILFQTSQFTLEPQGEATLSRCAEVLHRPGGAAYEQIQVEGHTDNVPLTGARYPRDNWELSAARALTVVNHMIGNGTDPTKLSANGYGEFRPLVGNDSVEGQRLNRRIELRLILAAPKRNTQGIP